MVKVLVIDDERPLRSTLQEILECEKILEELKSKA